MTPIKSVLDDASLTGTTLTVAGWVRTFRNDNYPTASLMPSY